MTPRPHDALFRSAFEHPAHAAAELRHVLPRELADAIEWSELRLEPGSFVDPKLADRHTDLLFSTSIDGHRALVYVLLEHQSTPDARMPFRVLVYMVRVWARWTNDHPDDPLPAIIPVVVTSTATDDELRSRALATFPMLALSLLRDGRDEHALFRNLETWAAAYAAVAAAPTGLHAFERLMRYVELRLPDEQFERFRARLVELAPTTEAEVMRYSERLIAEGEAKGREQGREQGRLDALRETLRAQLRSKFAGLDTSTLTRIDAASPSELERWLERVVIENDLDAVFRDDRH